MPELVANDAERGWLLMRDGGQRLRELVHSWPTSPTGRRSCPSTPSSRSRSRRTSTSCWARSVPDERLAVLPGHLAALLDDRDACMVGRENGLDEDEYERLRALLPDFAARCARLAAYGIPETIQHDDLHDGNVFVRDGRYLFFDWGDSCVSHPFHTLVVTMRALVHRLELPPGGPDVVRLRDAYLEPFAALRLSRRARRGRRTRALHRHRRPLAELEPLHPRPRAASTASTTRTRCPTG